VQAKSRSRKRRRERAANERAERQSQSSETERRSGLESLSQAEKAELEERGRAYAARELRDMGFDVKLMGQRSPGYDLLAKKGNEILEVEVKAHLRTASKVFVPKGEWKEYLRAKRDGVRRWELWNVEYLAEDAGNRVRITRYTEIPTDAIEESGFWVDLRLCSSQSSQ
jgi:Holliday junction resolvase